MLHTRQLSIPDLFSFGVIKEHTQITREEIERGGWADEDLLIWTDDFDRNTKWTNWNNNLEDYLYTGTGVTTDSISNLMI